ncbi:MAG: hypothetical protein GKR97_14530 [Rhizobiaceae bacterium]|nr:hypothetical protein [Rhizobiaceae bacterium]
MRRGNRKFAAYAGGLALASMSVVSSMMSINNPSHDSDSGDSIVAITFAHSVFNSTAEDWTLRDGSFDQYASEQQWIDQMTTGAIDKRRRNRSKAKRKSKSRSGLFGSVSIPFANISTAGQWQRASRKLGKQLNMNCGGSKHCKSRKAAISNMVKRGTKMSFFQKLNLVNAGANKLIGYQPDVATYNSRDYWAMPSESVRQGLGDCEDYVILKMAMLKSLNVPTKAMSLVVLKDTDRNLYHAVLAVSTNKGTFILDNVQKWVVLDKQLPHYLPLYSFSGKRSWVHGWKKSQKTKLAQANGLDFSKIQPGESFAKIPLGVDDISGNDLIGLRPTMTQFPAEQMAMANRLVAQGSGSGRGDDGGMVGYPR